MGRADVSNGVLKTPVLHTLEGCGPSFTSRTLAEPVLPPAHGPRVLPQRALLPGTKADVWLWVQDHGKRCVAL